MASATVFTAASEAYILASYARSSAPTTPLSREAAAFQINALHGRRPVVCEKCKYIKSEARRVSIAARDWRTATPGKLGIYLRERGKTTYSYSILSHFLLHFRPLPLIFLMSFRKSLMCRSGSR